MTVNFRRWVAAVALWLLITAGNSAQLNANDGLKPNRYRSTVDRSSIAQDSPRPGVANSINPLRSMEFQGTIETLENRNPVTNVSHSRQITLRAIHSTDALALLTPSNIGSVSTLRLKAENRSTTSNQVRILVDRPSTSMAIIVQAFDFTARIQKATTSFFEACSVQELEIARRLAVPSSLAVQRQTVPAITAGYSRSSIVPKRPVQPRTPLKSPTGSNYRVLLIESAEVELTPSTKFFNPGFPGFIGAGADGCDFFGECFDECNNCQLSGSVHAASGEKENRMTSKLVFGNLFGPQCQLSIALEKLCRNCREFELADKSKPARVKSPKVIFASSKSRSISSSTTATMFTVIGTFARTVKLFVDPYWNYARTFDLLKRVQTIPSWVFSALWPEYLGRSVSPYGILL